MEELLIGLLVGLYGLIARLVKKIREWLQRRGEPQPLSVPTPKVPPVPLLSEHRAALQAALTRLERIVEAKGRELAESGANQPLGEAMVGGLVPACRRLQDAVRSPTLAERDLERLTGEMRLLEELHDRALQVAAARATAPVGEALLEADRLFGAASAPLVAWAGDRLIPWARRRPMCYPGAIAPTAAWGELNALLLPVRVPAAFPDQIPGWAELLHDVGRDLLDNMPGLAVEIRSRLGVPERCPVLEVFGGFVDEREILQPFGAWLDVCYGDAVATLVAGPAYFAVLRTALASPARPRAVTTVALAAAKKFYAAIPPSHLRLRVAALVLERLGFEDEAASGLAAWDAAHATPQTIYLPVRAVSWDRTSSGASLSYAELPLEIFEAVLKQVAGLLLEGKFVAFGGAGLLDVPGLACTRERHAAAIAAAAELHAGRPVEAAPLDAFLGLLLAWEAEPHRARELLQTFREALELSGLKRAPEQPAAIGERPAEDRLDAAAIRDAMVLALILRRRASTRRSL